MSKKNFESGRSMVEMLGVLAVMGVLSVGGVAMYTNAMNKYRANELLNESSKRAVVVATQILSGKNISSDMINEFNNNGTTFTGVEAVGTNQFKLTLSGVDDDVCTQLKATVGSNTIIQEVGDKCAFLTFNNDLSKGTTSSGTNSGSNGGSGQQEPEPVDPCAGYDAGCCNNGDITGTSACDYNGGTNNGVCNAGKCEEAPQECDIKIRNIYKYGGEGSVNFYYSFDNGVSWKEIDKTKTGVLGASSQIKFKIIRTEEGVTREGICGVDDGSCNLDIPYGNAPDFILSSNRDGGITESENLLVDPKDCDSTAIFSILITEDD